MIAAGILFAGGVAIACSCVGSPTPKEALAAADAVFSGTVITIGEVPRSRDDTNFWWAQKEVSFRVTRTWKGTNQVNLVVRTGRGESDCGYHFVPGGSYLVYANWRDPMGASSTNLFTSTCTRTREYSRAADDLRELGVGGKSKSK